MKKFILLVIALELSFSVFCQTINYSLPGITNKKITSLSVSNSGYEIPAGTKVIILGLINDPTFKSIYLIKQEDLVLKISPSDIRRITLNDPVNLDMLWKIVRINSDLDANIISKGYQYDLRNDLEDETLDLLQSLNKFYGFFDDEFMDDYIQGLLHKIYAITLDDNRPGNLIIKILQTSQPNAFCTPTGTIIITTGLLSTIKSEDELIGVLSHEVAHFVLDHQIVNINKAIQRQKRAEFWSSFATAVAAASEAYLAVKYDVYTSGSITYATAILSTTIANSINERIGTNYNKEQEWEADAVAVMVLKYLKKDPKAFSTALSRIHSYCLLNGDFFALSSSGTHPGLVERIEKIGIPDINLFNDIDYDRKVSFVNTYNAINEYSLKHLETTVNLTNRNIESGVGTEDDYLLKAMAIRILFSTPEKNQEALSLIDKAKSLNVTPRNYAYKQEGITLIRLDKKAEASLSLQTYLKNLESLVEKDPYVLSEIEWTKKMIYKLKKL